MLKEFETQQSLVNLDLSLRKTRAGKSHDYGSIIVFRCTCMSVVYFSYEYEEYNDLNIKSEIGTSSRWPGLKGASNLPIKVAP